MSNSVPEVSLAQFLQDNVGLLWSFVIPVAGAALALMAKTVIETYKSFKVLDRQVRYEMGRDLLKSRSESFQALWQRLECLAKYSSREFSRHDAEVLSDALSAWYFSEKGGLYLTDRTRDFYFALQEITSLLSRFPDWCCRVRPADPKGVFTDLTGPKYVADFTSKEWKRFCKSKLPSVLKKTLSDKGEDAAVSYFAVMQQLSSALRDSLTHEIDSRLQASRPTKRRENR